MVRSNRKKTAAPARKTALLLLIAAAAGVAIAGGRGTWSSRELTRRIGDDRLVSMQSLQDLDGPMCQLVPASAGSELMAMAQGAAQAAVRAPADLPRPSDQAKLEASQRKPIRVMKDNYAAYSGIAVDPIRNEVAMSDENLFSIMVYDRKENTPPTAKMSEPKRIISGLNAEIEFSCALYIDPANGDIYVVNNDTLNTLSIFSHDQKGDVKPIRMIDPPHTSFGIAVYEPAKELYLTIQDDAAVVVYDKGAGMKDIPLRNIQGPKTLLADPHGIAIDEKRDLIYVSNWGSVNEHRDPKDGKPLVGTLGKGVGVPTWPIGRDYVVNGSGEFRPPSITVYPRTGKGDIAPLRVIQGPKTQMNWPTALAADPESGEIYVANDTGDSVLVFGPNQAGDVAPIRVIKGPKTMLDNPTGLALDLKNRELFVANFGNHMATVYPMNAEGNVAPLRVIRSAPPDAPSPMLGNPHSIRFDSKRKEILVANCVAHPQIVSFPRMAEGNPKPSKAIAGQNSRITRTIHDLAYDPIHDEIMIPQFYALAIMTFAGDADGDVAPKRIIMGDKTQLKNPQRLALDPVHNEVFVPQGNRVLVFDSRANGNVAPIRILESTSENRWSASALAVDPVHNLLIVSGGGGGDDVPPVATGTPRSTPQAEGGDSGGRGRGALVIFDRTAQGPAKPKAIIRGPKAGLSGGILEAYPPTGIILASVQGRGRYSEDSYVGVWSINDNGDVPPRWTIGGPHGMLRQTRAVTVDAEQKNVIISDKYVNAVLTYHFPEIF